VAAEAAHLAAPDPAVQGQRCFYRRHGVCFLGPCSRI